MRYVGNKSTKLYDAVPLNQWQANTNPEFLQAFKTTIQGGDAPLFDRMLMGLNVTGFGVVDGVTRTGSAALRTFTTTRTMLATGSVGALANFFNTTNAFTNENGGILRNAKLPETYFVAESAILNRHAQRQWQRIHLPFADRSGDQAPVERIQQSDFIHLEQRTRRRLRRQRQQLPRCDESPTREDATLLSTARTASDQAALTSCRSDRASCCLATAPDGCRDLVERWQFGGIANFTTGAPLNITANVATFNSTTPASNLPNIAGDFPKSSGKIAYAKDIAGAMYFAGFTQTSDPACGKITASQTLNTVCTNLAIKDASGNFILVNPEPGQLGNLGKRWIEGPSTLQFDMDLVKRIKVAEKKEFEIRLDAINILNHSLWATTGTGALNLDINSASFGRITNKTGNRTFTINTRLNF